MKKFPLFLLLIVLLCGSQTALAQWHSVTFATSYNLTSVHASGSRNFLVVGQDLNRVGGIPNGIIMISSDSGWTWYSDMPELDLVSGQMLDDSTHLLSTSFGFILHTTGHGQPLDVLGNCNGRGNTEKHYFINKNLGFAIGWYLGFISRTTDGGRTWTSLATPNLTGIHFPTPTIGFASGDVIMRTVDAGLSWDTVYTGSLAYDVYFTSATTGYALAQNGRILRTTNGGMNWSTINTGITGSRLKALHFPTPSVGYIVGQHGLILKTTDAGATWQQQQSSTTKSLNSIHCTGPNNCIAVGDSGIIIRTDNGGVLGVKADKFLQPLNLYPNPASGTVHFDLPEEPASELVLTNMLGQEVRRVRLQEHEQKVSIDCSGLSSGLYLYRLQNGQEVLRQGKLLLQQDR